MRNIRSEHALLAFEVRLTLTCVCDSENGCGWGRQNFSLDVWIFRMMPLTFRRKNRLYVLDVLHYLNFSIADVPFFLEEHAFTSQLCHVSVCMRKKSNVKCDVRGKKK